MSVWIEKIEKDYYQCNSCGSQDSLVKVRYGLIPESTSSFRMCDRCLSTIPNTRLEQENAKMKGLILRANEIFTKDIYDMKFLTSVNEWLEQVKELIKGDK